MAGTAGIEVDRNLSGNANVQGPGMVHRLLDCPIESNGELRKIWLDHR